MAKVTWSLPGKKVFEAGVDRGVLYPSGGPGVAWDGLVSVDEKSTGGKVQPHYYDGEVYLLEVVPGDYEGVISAFTFPDEFARMEGSLETRPGLFVENQMSLQFNLSYRTGLGNDLKGLDLGYKIHLIYGAVTMPADRSHKTQNNNTSPENFTWTIYARPPRSTTHRPTAHYIVDSRKVSPSALGALEEVLYGTTTRDGYIPSQDQIQELFRPSEYDVINGGSPSSTTTDIHNGGTPATASPGYTNGGSPQHAHHHKSLFP